MPLASPPSGPALDLVEGRATELGGLPIQRLLPRRPRRTIGAWCFLDLMGPADRALEVGPHPHIGLQTVTWLLDGEVVHLDSLGVEQPIRPGQLNLMTAGAGVAHAEEGAAGRALHGAQLWVAQPEATRHGPAAFEHHAELPRTRVGDLTAAVLVGELAGVRSPARHDSPLVGAELRTAGGRGTVELDRTFEHGVAVLDGALTVAGIRVGAGQLLHLGTHRDAIELAADAPTVALLLGGAPLGEELVMWWNFVGRSHDEIEAARVDWDDGVRFGSVTSRLPRVPAPPR